MHSIWLILVSLAVFAIAYRTYAVFLAARVAVIDDTRPTPSHVLKDGVDYHPTSRLVLFGHHFAAIAGPGPLVGPVLAAQWGYAPGFVWILLGACLAGAVHDFVILVASVRSDGLSLAQIARRAIGPRAGIVASIATLFIIVCTLASVAMVVVNALSESSWGMFTICVTILAALVTGLWMYRIRPGRVAEASVIGVAIVLLGVFLGRWFSMTEVSHCLLFDKKTLSLILPAYALVASVLPVWVLMCPRDYLSSYMKIGVMVVLGVGILVANPTLRMPAVTPFLSTGGPVISGSVWPFLCITIMCGAISGFHALVASGTTPKMISKESDIRPIAFGAMLTEGLVAVLALIAASSLHPGDYFGVNVPQDTARQKAAYVRFVNSPVRAPLDLRTHELPQLEREVGENLVGRTGGAVTLAVGMARIFSRAASSRGLMGYWYHFVIMFEALFILTLLETGTRVARFAVQEVIRQVRPEDASPNRPNWAMNTAASVVTCFAWGYLLYTGNLNNLWTMLGIANQLLASIALAVGTAYLLQNAPKREYALCTAVPLLFVLGTTMTAAIVRVTEWQAKIPLLRATDPAQVFPQRLLVVLASLMLLLTAAIATDTALTCRRRWIARGGEDVASTCMLEAEPGA